MKVPSCFLPAARDAELPPPVTEGVSPAGDSLHLWEWREGAACLREETWESIESGGVRNEDETELARGLLSGGPEAFEAFVQHFRTRIFHYAWLMCGQREDAEEVAQEALLRIFESFSQLREPERVRPWVFRIARNECLMKRRKSVFAPAHELSLEQLLPASPAAVADWSQLPETRVLQGELREALQRAIVELPEMYRAVLLLRDVEEMTTQETAVVLEVSIDVVKTRLHRARLAVRQKLESSIRAETRAGHGARM
jgi:RNA polymerase sigma-70 factor (ECF subfamily)